MSATEQTPSVVRERTAVEHERGAVHGLAPLRSRAGAALIGASRRQLRHDDPA
jgi:hypothetical protein